MAQAGMSSSMAHGGVPESHGSDRVRLMENHENGKD